MIEVPARFGKGFELLISHDGEEARVEAQLTSDHVLTVCANDGRR